VEKAEESIANEENIEIPNLEELLQQLHDMGFEDRDRNIRILKFHRRFREGLDETIEDLLSEKEKMEEREKEHREQENEKEVLVEEPKMEEVKEAKEEEKKEEDKEEEEEEVEEEEEEAAKEDEANSGEKHPNGKLKSEDIENLMREGNLTRQTAIKILLRQMWN